MSEVARNICVIESKKITPIEKLVKKLLSLPTWVKEYIYVELKESLSKTVEITKLNSKSKDELIQMYVPTPTAAANALIRGKFNQIASIKNLSKEQIQLLKSLGREKKILDICFENQWSLFKCSKILVQSIDLGLIEVIDNNVIANTIYYMAGRIRLGEYLLRLNKLSLEQIDSALFTQKEIINQYGTNTKIGELLVNLGYIKEVDKNEILKLKENSDYICNYEDETTKLKEQILELQKEMEIIKFENATYKEDLSIYQDELLKKISIINELESKITPLKEKRGFFKNLFKFNISAKKIA